MRSMTIIVRFARGPLPLSLNSVETNSTSLAAISFLIWPTASCLSTLQRTNQRVRDPGPDFEMHTMGTIIQTISDQPPVDTMQAPDIVSFIVFDGTKISRSLNCSRASCQIMGTITLTERVDSAKISGRTIVTDCWSRTTYREPAEEYKDH